MYKYSGVTIDSNNNLVFDWSGKSPDQVLSLTPGRRTAKAWNPFEKQNLGFPIYSVYKINPSKQSPEVLKALKGKSTVYEVSHEDYGDFINKGAIFAARLVSKMPEIDVILAIPSSSELVHDFVSAVRRKLSVPIVVYKHLSVIGKNSVDAITVSEDAPDVARTIIMKEKQKLIAAGITSFSTKKIPPRFRSFIRNMFAVNTHPEIFAGKNVLLVDDILTTGTSFENTAVVLNAMNVGAITGLTLIKSED